MALASDIVGALAARLDEAERTSTQIGQFTLAHPDMAIEDSYAIQREWVRLKTERGLKLVGHKIGLTSATMQRAVNINEPDYGALMEDMVFRDGGVVPVGRFILPRVEVELAFILKSDLSGPNCSIFDVLDATDYVVPSMEIIDARIERVDKATGVTRQVRDTIADNAGNAGIIIGGRPFRPDTIDMRWVSAALYRNGVVEDTGVALAVLNNPVSGPAWLANKLHPHGVTLKAGQIILGGSFTSPIDARPGDTFHADYGPVGSVTINFARD